MRCSNDASSDDAGEEAAAVPLPLLGLEADTGLVLDFEALALAARTGEDEGEEDN
jgi:hypothetical protein